MSDMCSYNIESLVNLISVSFALVIFIILIGVHIYVECSFVEYLYTTMQNLSYSQVNYSFKATFSIRCMTFLNVSY